MRSKKALIPLEIPGVNKRSGKFLTGLTLLELLAAMALLGVVLLTASSLLITFKKFYFDFMQRQTEIGEASLVVLEEIVNRIKTANNIAVTRGSRIEIRVDGAGQAPSPSDYSDDTTYTYWLAGEAIRYKYQRAGEPPSPVTDIAQHIGLLEFELQPVAASTLNQVKIRIGVVPSGSMQQDFETTVVARVRAAEAT